MIADAYECSYVFWKAGATITGSCIDEMIADAWVGADAASYGLDVRSQVLGEIGEFVHEADTGGQHHVGRILGQLRRAHVHVYHLVMITVERRVETLERGSRCFVHTADDDAIGLHEVVDRGTFLQELGIRHHVEVDGRITCCQFPFDGRAYLVGSADGYRRLIDDDFRRGHIAADGGSHIEHVR